ncbi:MAG: TlpA disulfide reductase family protein [Bacteroidota bacterium]|nr:TlpA disulfide reductase family protein [Bacteroidota bacterium]
MKIVKYITKILILFIISINVFASDNENKIEINSNAEAFFLRSLDGESIYFSRELKEGNVILLSFFATWCIPCNIEIPKIEEISTELTNEDFKTFYIHVGKPKKEGNYKELIGKMKDRLLMTQPILIDMYSKVAEKYDALALPTTILIGNDAKIKYVHVGYKKGDEKKLKIEVQKALGILDTISANLLDMIQDSVNTETDIDTLSDFEKQLLNIEE